LRVARQSGGGASAVTDEEAIAGMRLLAETEGIFAEAAGGVVIAALKELVASGAIKRNQLTVAFITGAGPRTQEMVSDIVQTSTIKPTIESFEEVLGVKA
jgi:threonine synthase